jgi:hypothetical protein
MRKIASWTTPLVALALAVGCDDGGTGGEDDAGTAPSLPVLTTGTIDAPTSGSPNLACLGTATQPTPGAPVDVTLELRDFEMDFPVSNTRVWFFRDNEIGESCDAPVCTELMTDSSGNAIVSAPASGWYAYRVFPRMGATAGMTVIGSMQLNEPAPAAAGSVVANAVSQGTINLIPAVLGIGRQPGTAVLAGTVMDCDETPVYGAIIRLFDGDTEITQGELATEPQYRYFDGDSFPSDSQPHTHVDGLYVGVQIPPPSTTGSLRIEAWGRPTEADAPRRIGCEATRALADEVTIINIGPERSDYPVGHPCAE